MKKLLLTGLTTLIVVCIYSQTAKPPKKMAVVKTVEWNLDASPSPAGLPLNQYINFKIKSKKNDLSKVVYVMIMEHHGNQTAKRSFKTYGSKKLLKKIYGIDDVKFHTDSSYLEVPVLVKDDEETDENRVLQPSRFYTFYFVTTKAMGLQERLLKESRAYVIALNAGSTTASGLLAIVQATHNTILNLVQNQRNILSAQEMDFNTYLSWYSNTIFPLETNIETAEGNLSAHVRGLNLNSGPLRDSVIHFILQSLNFNDKKRDSISKYPCEEPSCQLYRLFLGLYNLDDAELASIIKGEQTLPDAINPLFTPDPSARSVSKIDSNIVQIERLKNYLLVLRDNNLAPQTNRPPNFYTNRLYPEVIYTDIGALISRLNILQGQLRTARPIVLALINAKELKDDEYLNSLPFLHYSISLADTYVYNIETRNSLFIVPIFGYAVYGFQKGFTGMTPYTGLRFNFHQLDESVPFKLLRHKTIGQRFGFETGITIASFKKESKRENLFGNSASLFTGMGFKLSHHVCISGGVIWFRKEDPNPFISETKVTATFYAALSLNVGLKKIFEGLTGLIPLK